MFSVVIPTFNRSATLGEALRSVLDGATEACEIIVVDDGSTEDLSDVRREFGGRVTFVRQENAGPGVARNTGVAQASGEYVAFLDSDDVWFPWTLRMYAEIIAATGRPAVIAGKLLYFQTEDELAQASETPPRWAYFPDYYSSHRHGLYCGSCQAVIRRDAFLAAGGFTAARINAEDHDLTMRLGTAPGFVSVTSPCLIGYRQHSASMTGNLRKTYEGIRYLLRQEQAGAFPGGAERAAERRSILSSHVRPVSLELLRRGYRAEGLELYRETLGWHLQQRRFRYLAGFAAWSAAGRLRHLA